MSVRTDPVVVDHLRVTYGRVTAVDDVSFRIPRSEVYALLGRNGAGKSSTIQCLVGQRRATAGECRLLGRDAWRKRRKIMERVCVVPETPDLPPGASAVELGRFLGRVRPTWDADDFNARLDRVSVPRHLPAQRLSKGQRRQLALAAALAAQPEVLILDDPTLGLDAVVRRTLLEELVGELADRGTTILITTHDLAGIEGIADKVGIMQQGRLVYDETMEGLKARFRRLRCVRGAATSSEAIEAALARLDVAESRHVGAVVDAVVGRADEASIAGFREVVDVTDFELEALSLEEIFVALCGEEPGGA
jgi:ABC-2 type transport system ATP-binding protein